MFDRPPCYSNRCLLVMTRPTAILGQIVLRTASELVAHVNCETGGMLWPCFTGGGNENYCSRQAARLAGADHAAPPAR